MINVAGLVVRIEIELMPCTLRTVEIFKSAKVRAQDKINRSCILKNFVLYC